MKFTDWIMGKDMDFDEPVKVEEPPHVDPVIEQRRKEKFSEPMIYNEEKKVEEVKVEEKVPVVKKKEELSENDKTNIIALRLEGSSGTAYFASEEGRGIYEDENHINAATEGGVKIANILKGNYYDLRLEGETHVGASVTDIPESDKFTLILKIKKSEKN